MKKILAVLLVALLALSCTAALAEKVGVSMPTKDLQRWNQDGANMEAMLKEAGYEVDLQYASNDPKLQLDMNALGALLRDPFYGARVTINAMSDRPYLLYKPTSTKQAATINEIKGLLQILNDNRSNAV